RPAPRFDPGTYAQQVADEMVASGLATRDLNGGLLFQRADLDYGPLVGLNNEKLDMMISSQQAGAEQQARLEEQWKIRQEEVAKHQREQNEEFRKQVRKEMYGEEEPVPTPVAGGGAKAPPSPTTSPSAEPASPAAATPSEPAAPHVHLHEPFEHWHEIQDPDKEHNDRYNQKMVTLGEGGEVTTGTATRPSGGGSSPSTSSPSRPGGVRGLTGGSTAEPEVDVAVNLSPAAMAAGARFLETGEDPKGLLDAAIRDHQRAVETARQQAVENQIRQEVAAEREAENKEKRRKEFRAQVRRELGYDEDEPEDRQGGNDKAKGAAAKAVATAAAAAAAAATSAQVRENPGNPGSPLGPEGAVHYEDLHGDLLASLEDYFFGRIRTRLRAELLRDRERAGLLIDRR
ncbi:MAG: hypothetical protein ACRD0D_02225, partial [Acidimicrobiales bacterium]